MSPAPVSAAAEPVFDARSGLTLAQSDACSFEVSDATCTGTTVGSALLRYKSRYAAFLASISACQNLGLDGCVKNPWPYPQA